MTATVNPTAEVAAIECKGLTKHYRGVIALDQLDLSVPTGAIFGLLGPKAAGKTTLIRLLTGLARPSAGRARVAGVALDQGGSALCERISYLDQYPRYYSWMKGQEFLSFLARL